MKGHSQANRLIKCQLFEVNKEMAIDWQRHFFWVFFLAKAAQN